MAKTIDISLPTRPGVRLVKRPDGTLELTIQAQDAEQLAWCVHDVVGLIQTGQLSRAVEEAGNSECGIRSPDPGSRSPSPDR